MSLVKIVEEIKQITPFAEENLEGAPLETLAGRRGRKNQSIERLRALKRDYRRSLMESAVFIVVTGSAGAELEKAATETFGCFSANPTDFYDDLVNRIPPSLYQGKESMVNLFEIMGRHLEDKCVELDIDGYNAVLFKQEYYESVKNKADLTRVITKAVNIQMGSEIVGIQAVTSLVSKAIEKSHGAKMTPIVLYTDNESLALDLNGSLGRLRPKGTFLVVAGKGSKTLRAVDGVLSVKDVSNEGVGKVLKTISDSIKGNKE